MADPDRGAATLEGAAALAVAFLLLVLIAQVATALTARNAAESAAAATARRAARPGADTADLARQLDAAVRSLLPGAGEVTASVERRSATARARVSFTWRPPGPGLPPLRIAVVGESPLVVPP